jgi:transcriptional regulator with XRE-family HTH domain
MGKQFAEQRILRQLGLAISRRRAYLSISQEELARRAELHRTYICDVERGGRNMSLLTLDRIAISLDVTIATLFYLAQVEKAK